MVKSFTRGHSLIELIVSVAILSVAMAAVGWTFLNISQNRAQQDFLNALNQNRLSFQNLISSDRAWAATLANNPGMACMRTPRFSCTATAALTPQKLILYDQNAFVFFDGSNVDRGFDVRGAPCSFLGTTSCVLHIDLTWSLQCDPTSTIDPTCMSPYMQVRGNYSYGGGPIGPINFKNYNILLGRAIPRATSVTAPCPSPPTGACSAPYSQVCVGSGWQCLLVQ